MQLHQTPRDLLYHLEATSSSEAKRKWKDSIKEHWNYECAYCGSDENLTLDHVIPKSKGGSDRISNIICACEKCNQDKGHQFWSEWYLNQGFYTIDRLSAIIKWQTQK
jgi:5-methylcytosine-specific restriction endonuclease McrA